MNQLLFYQNIVGLDRVKHAQLHLVTPNTFEFAQSTNVIPLLASELDEAISEFPVVFIPSGKGEFILAAIADLRKDNNLFVKNGVWQGRYIPAFVRRYPFITIGKSEDVGQFMIGIDEAASCFKTDVKKLAVNQEAHLLFDGEKPGKMLNSLIPFLQQFHVDNMSTIAFCKKVAELGLITASTIKTKGKDGSEYQLQGVGLIDEAKLKKLDQEIVYDLFKTGALHQIYRQQFSLRNCGVLAEKLALGKASPPQVSPAPAVKQPSLPSAASKNAAPVTLKAPAAKSVAKPVVKPEVKAAVKPAVKAAVPPKAVSKVAAKPAAKAVKKPAAKAPVKSSKKR
jgi:hypothetical protein